MGNSEKIVQGLRDAIAGNLSRVTIDGQVWERRVELFTTRLDEIEALANKAFADIESLFSDFDEWDQKKICGFIDEGIIVAADFTVKLESIRECILAMRECLRREALNMPRAFVDAADELYSAIMEWNASYGNTKGRLAHAMDSFADSCNAWAAHPGKFANEALRRGTQQKERTP